VLRRFDKASSAELDILVYVDGRPESGSLIIFTSVIVNYHVGQTGSNIWSHSLVHAPVEIILTYCFLICFIFSMLEGCSGELNTLRWMILRNGENFLCFTIFLPPKDRLGDLRYKPVNIV
jgi:hypothetical protein